MSNNDPLNQKKLFGLGRYMNELVSLYEKNIFPNKLLLSGQKGIGKSTLAYHFINYILSKDEIYCYDLDNFEINFESTTFKTIFNKSNPNLHIIDIDSDKKFIDLNQIRNLIISLNKSSFNNKPRFVLIDNIELLNINSINALLKILEEPNDNIFFILINNNKKILSTLKSRCINYKINLTHNECSEIIYSLFDKEINDLIYKDFVNYYFTPGTIYYLVKFAEKNEYDLLNLSLKKFLKLLIKENHYKNDSFIKYIIYYLMESYFSKLNKSFSKKIDLKYSYFIRKISDTKTFNLDEESLFMEFEEDMLNG